MIQLLIRSSVLAVAATAIFSTTAVMADARFIYEGAKFEDSAQISIKDGKVLLADADAKKVSVIFDQGLDEFQLLDHAEKTYLNITTSFVKSMLNGVQAIMPQLQQLAAGSELSPKQQELLDSLAAAGDGPDSGSTLGSGQPVQVINTGKKESVHGLSCEVHSIVLNDSQFDVCTIAYSTIGLAEQDQQSLEKLSAVFEELAGAIELHEAQQLASVIGKLDGVMLQAKDANGEVFMKLKQLMLADVGHQQFMVPAEYTETDVFSILSGM